MAKTLLWVTYCCKPFLPFKLELQAANTTRRRDHLTFSYLRPVCSVPCMENLMLKVFIEILNANLQLVLKSLFKAYHKLLVKYQFLGATLYMFLNIMYLIVWKLESIGEKGKVWFNHMFLLVLKLLALLNNQLYFIILGPTDFATFLFWKVAVPAALPQNGYREHG